MSEEDMIEHPSDPDPIEERADGFDEGPAAGVATNGSSSLLDQLRVIREELGKARETALEVPGYEGLLFVKYQYVDGMWDEMKKIGQAVEKSKNPRKELYGQADTLLFACKEVVVYQPERADADENGYCPILPNQGVTKFDENLAEALGFEAKTAREVLFGVFRNHLAISKQHNELMDWAASNQRDLDKDTEGK